MNGIGYSQVSMDLLVDFILSFYGPTPYLIVLAILLLCGLGLPIPEDITLFVGGILSYYGVTDIRVMIAVCFFGVLLGDSIIFFMGAKYGKRLTQKGPFRKMLTEERLQQVQERFVNKGNKLIFLARFMPGLRAPIFFSAGLLKLPYRVFLFYNGGAALLSVPLLVYLPYSQGDRLEEIVRQIQSVERAIVVLIFLLILTIGFKWYRNRKKKSPVEV